MMSYLRYNFPVKFIGGPMVLSFMRTTSEYKVQVRSVSMLLENPMQVGWLSFLEQIALQMESSRSPSSIRITLGNSVVTTLYILYLIISRGMNLSSFAPQFFRTKNIRNLLGFDVDKF